ncbi:hypothetical protein IGI04_010378 [Brassica rapa subsp. trilocularis]|uniref:FAD-binding PCMH-type domain-containing protein n=1 Tax=Brassica rapa subsp. trilocularis TaxID=1813537 RepID=A0ABQ7MZY9_BRACM|nr:hypothetical protein IGI04_010378 [Brassica rapa subsp. trilocularis]
MKMKIFSRPTFLITLHLIYLITIPRVYSSLPLPLYAPELFLECLDTQPADHGSRNSRAAVIPTNASFSTNLMRAVRNLRFASGSTRKPEAIVAAVTETHIRATISCCKHLNLELKVRSGGHDYEGFSYTSPVPFVILDMYNFHKVDINLKDETATVEEGVIDLVHKWQQVAPVIDKDLFIRLEIKPVYRSTTSKYKTKTINVSFIGMFLGSPERLLNIMNKRFPELYLTEPDCMVKKWIDSVVFWAEYPENEPLENLLERTSVNESYWKRTSDFVQTPISKRGIAKIFQTMIYHSPLPRRVWMQWNPWGGRMAEIASDETPFTHRAGNVFMIEHFMNWYAPGDELEEAFLAISRSFKKAMTPFVSKNPREAFLNYRDVDIGITIPGYNATFEEAKVYGDKYFKGNYLRLFQVKAGFDPTNFFRSQQGIPVLE